MNRPTKPRQPERRYRQRVEQCTNYLFRNLANKITLDTNNHLCYELNKQDLLDLVSLLPDNFVLSADNDEFIVTYSLHMSDEEYAAHKKEVDDRYSREYNEYIQALAKYNYDMTLWEREQLLKEVEQTRTRLKELKSKLKEQDE